MSPLNDESTVQALGEYAAQRVTRRTIKALREMKVTLSADDSGLETTWDEICVQIQFEQSFSWEIYDETVRTIVGGELETLPLCMKDALWLQTEPGNDWRDEEPDEREPYPVLDDDCVEYVVTQQVYLQAESYSTKRIRRFLRNYE